MIQNMMMISEGEIRKLGFPVNTKGFYYLIYASVFAAQIGMRKVCLNKEIYDRIADIYDVSRESVEKCIRNCVDTAWRESKSNIIAYIGKDGRKPTNGEVIAFISSRITLERGAHFC